ncbi:hypothetical protein K438DRAFT_631067 [Mycena galopus ATCC 62051]|nr:hypothetical protein K438DRAFT_631067 [Mycena galopus ATCC 62051]
MTSRPIFCPNQSVVTYGFIVDGHLHRLRLKNSLETLVNHWNILGARIVKDTQSLFEYHIPSTFGDEVEAFTFDSEVLSTPLSDRFEIPPPTAEPSIFTPSPSTIFQPPIHLRHDCLSQYESASQPILHLQIVQFSDEKTSVGLTVPRCFCDAGGMKEILSAWSSILAKGGITENIPAVIQDRMALENEREDDSDTPLPSQVSLAHPDEESKKETRWLFMPSETLVKLTRECRDDLALQGCDVQVDETDVLLA